MLDTIYTIPRACLHRSKQSWNATTCSNALAFQDFVLHLSEDLQLSGMCWSAEWFEDVSSGAKCSSSLDAPVWNYHSEPQVVRKRFCICMLLCCNAAVRRFLSLVLTFNELLVSHIFTRSQIHQLRPLNMISGGGCTTLTSAHSIMPHFLDVQPFSKLVATEQVQAKQWSSSFNMFQLIITLASFVKASFKHPSSTVCGTRMNSYWLWVSSLMDCNTAIPTHYTGSDS